MRRLKNTTQVVDYFIRRFMRVPPADEKRQALIAFLNKELGTTDIARAKPIWKIAALVLHLIMSQPEYQLS